MALPFQSDFLIALGWTLLNSLWQFALLWLIFRIFTTGMWKLSAAYKHTLAFCLLSAGSVWFVVSLVNNYIDNSILVSQAFRNVSDYTAIIPAFLLRIKMVLEKCLPYLSFGYLLFVLILFTRFLHFFKRSQKLKSKGLKKLSGGLRVLVAQFCQQLDIRRKVQVWASEFIDTPMIIGFVKPTILIPLACINQLSIKQLEAILLHELAHIKRNDYALNLFISFTEIIFFFNPFARLFATTIRHERENSCDDWVLQYKYDPFQYASALLLLEQNRSQWSPCGISARGDNKKTLLNRVQRIMKVKLPGDYSGIRPLASLISALTFACTTLLWSPDYPDNKDTVNAHPIINLNAKIERSTNSSLVDLKAIRQQSIDQPLTTTKSQIKSEVNLGEETYVDKEAPEFNLEVLETTLQSDDWGNNLATLASGLVEEEADFSIPEKELPVLPAFAPTVENYPYVPHSSFYYERQVDTTKPKVKKENYYERIARESLTKAQIALDKLDWKKIEKHLTGKSKIDIKKLQQEIQLSLKEVNWQKVNEEVRNHINKESIEDMKASLKFEYDKMLQYKEQQQHLQDLQNQIEQMQKKYKEEAEKNVYEIRRQVKKTKVTVYI